MTYLSGIPITDFAAACRLLTAILFLFSGLSKMVDIASFSAVLRDQRLVPLQLIKPAVVALPVSEFALGGWFAYGGPAVRWRQ